SLCGALQAQHETPASMLLFPLFRTSAEILTVVNVTNIDTTPKTKTSYGGSTMVGFQYMNVTENPANGFRPLACTAFCRGEFLTPADTLSVLTYCHDISFGGRQQGYLTVIAMDPERYKTPWSHEALIGSTLHVKLTGASYQMLPYPIHTRVPHHLPTD